MPTARHLAVAYDIKVVDLLENPNFAAGDQIVAVPTLIRKIHEPVRRTLGDLSDRESVLVGLYLRPLR